MALIRKVSQGGGLFNILDANAKWPMPKVGDGATILHYSDRTAATVIAVDEERGLVQVQEDHAKRTDSNGMSEAQTYEYSRNEKGSISVFKRNKEGRWYLVVKNPETGRWVSAKSGTGIKFGYRDEYYDPCF